MSAPAVSRGDYRDFLRILATRRPGTLLTVDAIRDELDAAGFAHPSLGMLFQRACYDRVIVKTGGYVPARPASARGRAVAVYRVTGRREPPARPRREATRSLLDLLTDGAA